MTAHREHDTPNPKCEMCTAKCMVCNRAAAVFGEAWDDDWYGMWQACAEHKTEAVEKLARQVWESGFRGRG